jgi:hypothetical protein
MRVTHKLGLLGLCAALIGGSVRADDPASPPTFPSGNTIPTDSTMETPGPTRIAQAPATPPVNSTPAPATTTPPVNSTLAPATTTPPVNSTPAPATTTPPATAPATPRPVVTPADIARGAAPATSARARRAAASLRDYGGAPIMQGDQSPAGIKVLMPYASAVHASANSGPPVPPSPNQPSSRRTVQLPWLRGFKIADNQSPAPQDRLFFSFDYFNGLNGSVNRALNSGVSNMQLFRELFGAEKTFLDGDASLGIRLPLNTLTAKSSISGLGGTTTALGNMTVYGKYVLWRSDNLSDLISTGLAVTVPNGPKSFAGSPAAVGLQDSQIQPFVGYLFNRGDFFVQGFEAIDVPTNPHDVTMLYNDIGLGYYIYRSDTPGAFIRAITPVFETHVNIPLNHRGALVINDPTGTADIVDLTFGVNFLLRDRSQLSIGFVDPVTGPRPFNYEWIVALNWYYGRTAASRARANMTPPLLSQ